jgi:hypothetical protein
VATPSAGLLLARKVTITAPGQAADLEQQLRQLQELTLYNVESVVGASEQQDTVWVLLEPVPSCTVKRLLAAGEITVQQRAILALDLLAGLAELHGAGLGHARLTERTTIVDVEGRLRLAEPWRLPGEAADPASEVRRAGELVCWILGVGSRPGGSLTPAEQQAPAMVAVARSLAAGSESKATDAFQALREAAGRMAQRGNLEPSRAELSRRVRGLVGMPTAADPPPAPPPPPEPRPPAAAGPRYAPLAPGRGSTIPPAYLDPEPEPAPQRPRPSPPPPFADQRRTRRGPVLAVAAAVVAGLLLLLLVILPAILQRTASSSGAGQSQARHASPSATAPPSKATPTPQQSLGGAVTGFQLAPQNCQPGARCSIRTQVSIQQPAVQTEVTWRYKVTDVCHGNTTTDQAGSSVTAQPGWTFVFGIASVTLPNTGKVQIVAETSSPADATSDPVTIGSAC